jgi:23S rRNA (cytosine1962-C5)-methyltransferase
MKSKSKIIIKEGREKPILQRHQWIFSGAVESKPSDGKGSIVPVYSKSGNLLAHAMYNPDVSIVGRIISFGSADPLVEIKKNIGEACKMRMNAFDNSQTNAYRLINAEGDFLPGLVVDRYDDVLVMQIFSSGMDNIRELIVNELVKICKPKAIYEKSRHGSRQEEGLQSEERMVYGNADDKILILENGNKFIVSPKTGQKTGFFLDQREMRKKIGELSSGKKVLNCFSYTGGFSIYALKGGACSVDSVELSQSAQELAEKNVQINDIDAAKHRTIKAGVFDFLKEDSLDYNLIILDPPAFAKKRNDVNSACKGYKDINYMTLKKIPPNSLLLTCSCSAHVPSDLFQKVVFQAALLAGRKVQIIGRHHQGMDHPINIYHPETEYLKSLLLYIM